MLDTIILNHDGDVRPLEKDELWRSMDIGVVEEDPAAELVSYEVAVLGAERRPLPLHSRTLLPCQTASLCFLKQWKKFGQEIVPDYVEVL